MKNPFYWNPMFNLAKINADTVRFIRIIATDAQETNEKGEKFFTILFKDLADGQEKIEKISCDKIERI